MVWNCVNCAEDNESGFDICWKCGTGRDGSPASADFLGTNESISQRARERKIECLRCRVPMKFGGLKKLHEGTRAWPFLLGDFGELLVHREYFNLYLCPTCGKVELFVEPDSMPPEALETKP